MAVTVAMSNEVWIAVLWTSSKVHGVKIILLQIILGQYALYYEDPLKALQTYSYLTPGVAIPFVVARHLF